MNIEHQIAHQLRTLRLGGFLETLDLRLKQAREEEFDHLVFLQLMIQDEIERREARKLNQRLSRASFEEEKTMEVFDFSFNPKIKRPMVKNLVLPRRDKISLIRPRMKYDASAMLLL